MLMGDQTTPNLLFIMSDDHAGYVLGCYGNMIANTPNLDRLAADGVRLANHFCNSPVSSPSRQSILTGSMPHSTGVTVNSIVLDPDIGTLPKQLASVGYNTAAFGVMHFNCPGKPGLHGFATAVTEDIIARQWQEASFEQIPPNVRVKPDWKPFRDPARIWLNADALPYARFERDMESSVILLEAESFLNQNANSPFALWISFPEPHSPYNFPIEDAGAYDPAQFMAPEVGPDDCNQVPLIFRDLTTSDKQGIISAYYTSVRYLDRTIGRILDKLDALGMSDNTLVVYLPDHGYCLGQHGRFEKHSCYDPALRVPCLLRWPERLSPAVINDLTESADIGPTILDLLGVPAISGCHGRSLASAITGAGEYRPREYIFAEYLGNQEACIRTSSWKFVQCAGLRARTDGYVTDNPEPGRYVRLFNLVDDPDECFDVAGAHPDVVAKLSSLMLDRFRSTHPQAASEPSALDAADAIDWYLCR